MGEWVEAEMLPTKGFALRPGWHSGLFPDAPWLNKKDGSLAPNRVWCECEIPARSLQVEADRLGGEIKGSIPKGGHYRFKRQGTEWFISGSIKVNRILSKSEVTAILQQN